MTVAVLTTADRDGWWWGCPVDAVTPVSMGRVAVRVSGDVPDTTAFAIHVLRAGQESLAAHFASNPTDFDAVQTEHGMTIECGLGAVPLLCGVASRLECRPITMVRGQDLVVLAEVLSSDELAGAA
jgi:flavin reductase (DIM6/NTAB) family NADH-FMN oxidoreductase RutF